MKLKAIAIVGVAAVLAVLLWYSQSIPPADKISGFIEADEIRLGSRVGGRIAEVLVEEGQQVKAGELLLRLEPFDLKELLAEAEANLDAKRARLLKMQAGLRKEEIEQAKARVARITAVASKLKAGPLPEEIAAAKSRLELATAQLERARSANVRNNDLFNRNVGAVTRDELEQSIEGFKVAEANEQVRKEELLLLERGARQEDIAAAEADLQEALQSLQLAIAGYREEEIQEAAATVAAAEATVAALQTRMKELEVRAGVDGVVDALRLRPGDIVSANSPVLTLIDTHRLLIRAYVPENRLNLELGQRVRVTVDSYPVEEFEAELTFISTDAEFTPRNVQTVEERSKQMFRIKLRLIDGLDRLHPGMAADVWLGDVRPQAAAKRASSAKSLVSSHFE